jgi:acetylcholinesterase
VKVLFEHRFEEHCSIDCVFCIMPSLTQFLFLAALPIIAVAVLWSPFSQDLQIPWSFSSNDPQVSLTQGLVIGTNLNDKFPAPIEAFMGLPYSQPPTGDRRFRRAVPLPASNDSIKAQKYGPMFDFLVSNFLDTN